MRPILGPVSLGIPDCDLDRAFYEVRRSGKLTEGPYTRKFEDAVCEWSGAPYAVATSSCGAGLFAVYRALKRGSLAVPVNTFAATGTMAEEAGHAVYLMDCRETDPSVPFAEVERVLKAGVQAVVLTHVGGGLARDYRAIAAACGRAGVPLIEDAAHVLGTKRGGVAAGAYGLAAVFSLYPTKAVPAGECGVVVTHDQGLAQHVREFRNYGKKLDAEGRVVGYGPGFNLRVDEWTAAVAYLQVKRIPEILRWRAFDAEVLREVVPPLIDWDGYTNWYKYVVPAGGPWKRKAGKVYDVADQLTSVLRDPTRMPAAESWAGSHDCLPIGEGMYRSLKPGEVERWLFGEGG